MTAFWLVTFAEPLAAAAYRVGYRVRCAHKVWRLVGKPCRAWLTRRKALCLHSGFASPLLNLALFLGVSMVAGSVLVVGLFSGSEGRPVASPSIADLRPTGRPTSCVLDQCRRWDCSCGVQLCCVQLLHPGFACALNTCAWCCAVLCQALQCLCCAAFLNIQAGLAVLYLLLPAHCAETMNEWPACSLALIVTQ